MFYSGHGFLPDTQQPLCPQPFSLCTEGSYLYLQDLKCILFFLRVTSQPCHFSYHFNTEFFFRMGFPGSTVVKNLRASAGDARDLGLTPGLEDPLEEEVAAHSNILAWRIPWTGRHKELDMTKSWTSWTCQVTFFRTTFKVKVAQSCPTLWDPLELYSPWNSSGQNTGVGKLLSFLQGIFPTQGSNIGLQHCRQILY